MISKSVSRKLVRAPLSVSSFLIKITILPVTDNTWAMEWQETRRNTSDGDIIETAKFKAILTVLKKAPETEEQWDHNPFGIWIIDFEWEKKL
ncbi:MAG: type IV secretion system protein [Desulfobacteraceae bacterium]|nr:type IV secretion system protein [Desulfobacteraceae bacterium]